MFKLGVFKDLQSLSHVWASEASEMLYCLHFQLELLQGFATPLTLRASEVAETLYCLHFQVERLQEGKPSHTLGLSGLGVGGGWEAEG